MIEQDDLGAPVRGRMAEAQRAQPAPVSRPFVLYAGTEVEGTVTGTESREGFCALPYTENSRYRLNRDTYNQIFPFFLTARGDTRSVYCLDLFAPGPFGDVPFRSAAFDTLFPQATARQKRMLAWMLANTFPVVGARETFALARVDTAAAPALDDSDAFAAVQAALWILLGQLTNDEARFIDCASGLVHTKSERLHAAALGLVEQAQRFADTAATASAQPAPARAATAGRIRCSGVQPAPADASEPYLVFAGCPGEARGVDGGLLVGPFRLESNLNGETGLAVEPLRGSEEGFSAAVTDRDGNPAAAAIGRDFYLSVRSPSQVVCFTVQAAVRGMVARVLTMGAVSPEQVYQPVGGAFEDPIHLESAALSVCAENPREEEERPEQRPDLPDVYICNFVFGCGEGACAVPCDPACAVPCSPACGWVVAPCCGIPCAPGCRPPAGPCPPAMPDGSQHPGCCRPSCRPPRPCCCRPCPPNSCIMPRRRPGSPPGKPCG